jgi:lipoprotein NlpI
MRSLVGLAEDGQLAAYWQLMLWIAQRRAGNERPTLEPRERTGEWPRPLLELLEGRRDEASIAALLRQRSNELTRREQLCEALYYAGQQQLSAGNVPLARRYFAAAVNLKVLYFMEHHLASAALAAAGN